MIYTVTLNPTLDCYMLMDAWEKGKTNRAAGQTLAFGGKGINVSVVLTRLGVPTVALGFAAGFVGEALCRYLETEGVRQDMICLAAGHTRINVKLMGGEETEINAPGPQISEAALVALEQRLQVLTCDDILVLSGSIPSSLPKDTYGRLIKHLPMRDIRVVVDAEGEALLGTLPYRPFLVKPNLQELSSLAGKHLSSLDEISDAAAELQRKGARCVLVSMGQNGAMLLDETGRCHRAPAVGGQAINTVGAGDSMVAGYLAGLPQGSGTALRMGIAAGGATACGEGLATREAVLALLSELT